MLKIIHFDIGANMAFAHNGCEDVVVTEHFLCTGARAQRFAQALRWLARRFKEMNEAGIVFDVVHYERPFSRGFDATRSGWGYAGILEAVKGDSAVILDSTPQAIKSFALGSKKIGRGVQITDPKTGKKQRRKLTSAEKVAANQAEKLAMIAAAQALGYHGENEHEADAYLGLKYAERHCARTLP